MPPFGPTRTAIAATGIIIAVLLCAAANPTLCATKTWTGSTSTDWGTAGNWTPSIPVDGDAILIPSSPTGGRFPTISSGTYSYPTSTLNIQAGATLTQSGGTLTVKDISSIQSGATLTLSGGTLVIKNNLIIAAGPPVGTYSQSNGLLQAGHDIKNSGTINCTGGTVQFGQPGAVTLSNTAVQRLELL